MPRAHVSSRHHVSVEKYGRRVGDSVFLLGNYGPDKRLFKYKGEGPNYHNQRAMEKSSSVEGELQPSSCRIPISSTRGLSRMTWMTWMTWRRVQIAIASWKMSVSEHPSLFAFSSFDVDSPKRA